MISKGVYYDLSHGQRTTGKFCKRLRAAQRHTCERGGLFLYFFGQNEAQNSLRAVQHGTLRRRFELYSLAQSDDDFSSTQTFARQRHSRLQTLRQNSLLPYRQRERGKSDYFGRGKRRLTAAVKSLAINAAKRQSRERCRLPSKKNNAIISGVHVCASVFLYFLISLYIINRLAVV